MTTIVAVVTPGAIVLGADSRTSMEQGGAWNVGAHVKRAPKIVTVNGRYLAVSGAVRDCDTLGELLIAGSFFPPTRLRDIASALWRRAYEISKEYGQLINNDSGIDADFLLADSSGVCICHSGGSVYDLADSAIFALGSGSAYAMGAMYAAGMDEPKRPIDIARWGLMTAEELDKATGGDMQLITIDRTRS